MSTLPDDESWTRSWSCHYTVNVGRYTVNSTGTAEALIRSSITLTLLNYPNRMYIYPNSYNPYACDLYLSNLSTILRMKDLSMLKQLTKNSFHIINKANTHPDVYLLATAD